MQVFRVAAEWHLPPVTVKDWLRLLLCSGLKRARTGDCIGNNTGDNYSIWSLQANLCIDKNQPMVQTLMMPILLELL